MSCVRSWDGFAKPVQFTYKGDDQFTTFCGGLSSIFTFILIFVYAAQQIIYIWLKPDYNEQVQKVFTDFTSNTDTLTFNTDQVTLAANMVVFDGSVDPETIARIQFFQTDRPN